MTTSPTRQRRKARLDRFAEILKSTTSWNEAVRRLMAEEAAADFLGAQEVPEKLGEATTAEEGR